MNETPPPPTKRRWYRLTPDRFLIGLLGVQGILWLSERFGWFPFNEKYGRLPHKNRPLTRYPVVAQSG